MDCCCWEFLWYIFPEKQFGSRCGINPGAVRRTAVTCPEAYDTAGSLGACRSRRPFSGSLEVEDHKQVTPDIPGSQPHCNTWFSEVCLKTLRDSLRSSEVTGRTQLLGIPWLSSKEPASHCRRHRFDPWSRKFPRGVEQRSSCAATIESKL